ncbi:hypothetical protein ACU4GD_39170 [Cupriavidus basilensis]
MQRGIDALQQTTATRADRYASTLESTLDRYEFLPALVSLHPFVHDLLAAPGDPAQGGGGQPLPVRRQSPRAHAIGRLCVIAASGLALAASNHDQPDSFVGTDYQLPPLFPDRPRGEVGRYAIGITQRRTRLLHRPAREGGRPGGGRDRGQAQPGVVPARGPGGAEPVMVSDEHGVVFLSSVPAWQYRTPRPLPPELQSELDRTRQYHDQAVTPLPLERAQSPVTALARPYGAGRGRARLARRHRRRAPSATCGDQPQGGSGRRWTCR